MAGVLEALAMLRDAYRTHNALKSVSQIQAREASRRARGSNDPKLHQLAQERNAKAARSLALMAEHYARSGNMRMAQRLLGAAEAHSSSAENHGAVVHAHNERQKRRFVDFSNFDLDEAPTPKKKTRQKKAQHPAPRQEVPKAPQHPKLRAQPLQQARPGGPRAKMQVPRGPMKKGKRGGAYFVSKSGKKIYVGHKR